MWAGVSIETGGEILVGLNNAEGCLFELKEPFDEVRYIQFESQATSIGIGLGGSATLNFLMGLNIDTPSDMPGCDSGIDFSADLVIGGASKYLRSIPNYLEFMYEFQKGWKAYLCTAGKGISFLEEYKKLKFISENLYKNMDGIKGAKAGKPAVISIPISTGLRLSVNYKFGVTDVVRSGTISIR